MSKLKELREKRAQASTELTAILKQDLTPESRASADKAIADIATMESDIQRIEQADKIDAQLRANQPVDRTAPLGDLSNVDPKKLGEEYRTAFISMLKNKNTGNVGFGPDSTIGQAGISNVSERVRVSLERGLKFAQEHRDGLVEGAPMLNHIGTYTGLGYFVPTGFVNAIEQATKYFAPLLDGSVITVMDTATGQPLPMPTSNDTAQQATIVGEASPVSEQDVTASQINFGAYKFTSGLVKASLELIQDSAFDLEAWLAARFAERWGRGLENFLTNGTGNSQPTGLLTAVAASGATPIVAAGSSESTGGAQTGANSIGYSDLVNLEHSVDPSYRRGAKYMFHDQTLSALKRILDKFGRPLWTPGIAVGEPDRINGYQYVINQSMPVIAPSATTIAFGDMKKFIARRVKDLTVMKLVERYAELGQVGFVSFARLDANLLDAGTHPINTLQQHS
jgi:HK97 family phage major capsid protein